MYVNGHFMLVFNLTPVGSFSGGHTSPSENGNIRTELKFDTQLANLISTDYGGLPPEETSHVNKYGGVLNDVTSLINKHLSLLDLIIMQVKLIDLPNYA